MKKRRRIVLVDILRGFAALSVFLTHLGNPFTNSIGYKIVGLWHSFFRFFFWCNEGIHPGVVVFIVLSGFCIHMPLCRTAGTEPDWIYYGKRRFLRIYPVMVFAVFAGRIALYFTNADVNYDIPNFVQNIFLVSAIFPVSGPLGNELLLTVIVECVLYIIYPFGYFATKRYSWRVVLMVCFVIYALNISWLFLTSVDPSWVPRNTFSLLFYWWIGAFAMQVVSNSRIRGTFNHKILILGYVGYFLISHLLKIRGAHYLNSFILAILAAYLLAELYNREIFSQENGMRQNRYDLLKGIFSDLGEKSYSLYVVHLPVLTISSYYLAKYHINEGWLIYTGKIIAVAIFTGIFFYFIERPFHRYAVKTSNGVC